MKTNLRLIFMSLLTAIGMAGKAQLQVPIMNSNPSAVPVIFLDFDGHTVNNTGWNYNGPIYCGATTLDTASIRQVFNRVAEDYKPFMINVTTDSTKFLAALTTRRVRVLLTVSYEWYTDPQHQVGGVANVGSFADIADDPCFVFTSSHQNSIKNISEAASHEAGHTLGLFHQARWNLSSCALINEYHTGLGTGETSWAPIMGIGYTKNLTTWNIGPDPYGCNRIQDDASIIIQPANGITYRADDFDSTFAAAQNIPFSSNQFNVNGEIEKSYDKDMIKFTLTSARQIRIDLLPFSAGAGNAGSNLDILAKLYTGSQVLLNIYNPASILSATIDTTLNAGTYYLKVQGTANANAPEFASMGSYIMNAQLSGGGTLPLRVLRLMGTLTGDKHNLSWIIDADEQIVSQIVEVSTDGRSFAPVINTGDGLQRAYTYKPFSTNNTLIYRLNVTFDNGKQYYSNIVAIRQSGNVEIPKLVTNVISSNAVNVTSPGVFDYAVYDYAGKSVAKGKLNGGINTIQMGNTTSGMYIIRYAKGTEQWADKFVRQ
jgi:hypothetical protein